MKVILGAGSAKPQSGWIATDKDTLDITSRESFLKFFSSGEKVEVFFAEHVWEHLSSVDGVMAAHNCLLFLKPGGHLRIAVPDALHPGQNYIDWVKPGGAGPGGKDHRMFYDHLMLRSMLTTAGFSQVIPLEWWDENGLFHKRFWCKEDGFVSRSADHDYRNTGGVVRYTSLIVDAISDVVPVK
jgi:predicted SAM-dependent methyltransferase